MTTSVIARYSMRKGGIGLRDAGEDCRLAVPCVVARAAGWLDTSYDKSDVIVMWLRSRLDVLRRGRMPCVHVVTTAIWMPYAWYTDGVAPAMATGCIRLLPSARSNTCLLAPAVLLGMHNLVVPLLP